MHTFGTSHFGLYREVVLSLEVGMYISIIFGSSKCVFYREVILSLKVEMYWYNTWELKLFVL